MTFSSFSSKSSRDNVESSSSSLSWMLSTFYNLISIILADSRIEGYSVLSNIRDSPRPRFGLSSIIVEPIKSLKRLRFTSPFWSSANALRLFCRSSKYFFSLRRVYTSCWEPKSDFYRANESCEVAPMDRFGLKISGDSWSAVSSCNRSYIWLIVAKFLILVFLTVSCAMLCIDNGRVKGPPIPNIFIGITGSLGTSSVLPGAYPSY